MLTPEIRASIARSAGVAPANLISVGGFESFVYEAELRGQPAIIKATWSGRRSPDQIGAEQHFLRHLGRNGADVCAPVPLPDGAWLASVPAAEGSFLVHAFERAPGAREHALAPEHVDAVPLFMELREVTLWAVLTRSVPESERSAAMREDVAAAGERIAAERPALDLRW